MTMDKQTNVKLETTADFQPLSQLNVNFYNRDINTSVLNFIVTRNQYPLLLGNDNVDTNITLKFSDGSMIRDDLTIKDGMNGILSYTLSNEMLQHTGKVTGQVEISIKGKEDTVVQRLFSFNISKSLIDDIDAETKLVYIKQFADLEKDIIERYERMETTFADGEKLAQAVVDASNKGLEDIEQVKTESIEEINNTTNSSVENIQSLSNQTLSEITTNKTEIYQKVDKFNSDVQAGDYVKTANTSKWQKYAFTLDTGKRQWLGTLNKKLETLAPGYYEATVPVDNVSVNAPADPKGEGYLASFNIYEANTGRKQIFFTQNYHNRHYVKTIHTNGTDRGWREFVTAENTQNIETVIGSQQKVDTAIQKVTELIDEKNYDTGWQELPLMSGVENDTDTDISKYRIKNGICSVIFNLKMTKSQSEIPFATLPIESLPNVSFEFLANTTNDDGKNPVKCSYDNTEKVFKILQNNSNTINTGDIVRGYVTYITG